MLGPRPLKDCMVLRTRLRIEQSRPRGVGLLLGPVPFRTEFVGRDLPRLCDGVGLPRLVRCLGLAQSRGRRRRVLPQLIF